MRNLLLILLLASNALCAGPKHNFDDANLNDELDNVYYDIDSVSRFGVRKFRGVTDGTTGCAGCVGEVIESKTEGDNNCPATGVWADLTSISLTPGDWEVSGGFYFAANDQAATSVRIGISATSGNVDPGGVEGWDQGMLGFNSSTNYIANLHIGSIQKSITATTTTYLKVRCTYPAGIPITRGYALHARRMR